MRDLGFGNFIYECRIEKGLSQSELGELMGVTNKAVSKWESGSSKHRTDDIIGPVGALLFILLFAVAVTTSIIFTGELKRFPVYRLTSFVGLHGAFSANDMIKVMYVGSPRDRASAQSVIDLANEAFGDCKHTEEENVKKYGELSRYAPSKEDYPEVDKIEYSLKLWSAHLGKDKGWLWVYYSQSGYAENDDLLFGSHKIPSLWRVEKNLDGNWKVVQIKEVP